MTQVGSHLYSLPPVQPRMVGPAEPQEPAAAAPRSVQFSGGLSAVGNRLGRTATKKLLPIFQAITEVFLVGFLARDVVAMWMPRVWTSLKVGRINYEPSEDPAVRDLPFLEQAKIWLKKNIKGLNWDNFNEETKREFATGPGVLIIPAVAYAWMRRTLGHGANEMSYKSLKGLSLGFQKFLKDYHPNLASKTGPVAADAYKEAVAGYLSGIFQDPNLRDTVMGGDKKYSDYLDDWARQWTGAFFEKQKGERDQVLHHLAQDLKENLMAFNRKHRIAPYEVNGKTIKAVLEHLDHTQVKFLDKLEHKSISEITENLHRWGDFAKAVWDTKSKQGRGNLAKTLPDVVEGLFKKLAARKLLFASALTVLSAFYLIKLAFWAASHDSYQATRLLNNDSAGSGHGAGSGASPQPVAKPPEARQPVQAPAVTPVDPAQGSVYTVPLAATVPPVQWPVPQTPVYFNPQPASLVAAPRPASPFAVFAGQLHQNTKFQGQASPQPARRLV